MPTKLNILPTAGIPPENEMRTAIANRDLSYDNQFFYGVITTGIFCKPSCTSKAAKAENIRFFSTTITAMLDGFRPCKRCNPVTSSTRLDSLINLARYIEKHANEKITLADLGKIAELSPAKLQKMFKATFGVSPKAYQDAARMHHFKRALRNGDGVTDAIYSSGFGSISRVYGEASRNIGMTPKSYRKGALGEVIYYANRNTAIGLMMMAATERGVCFVSFADESNALLTQLQNEFPNAHLTQSNSQNTPELDAWVEALDQHVNQNAPKPNLPLDIRGTAFQIKVWQFLLSIKEGETFSYSEVAKEIDKPKAVRAVASACGKNRIGILIPCHRVLRNDGGLGGYRWGLERKRTLLNKEK